MAKGLLERQKLTNEKVSMADNEILKEILFALNISMFAWGVWLDFQLLLASLLGPGWYSRYFSLSIV